MGPVIDAPAKRRIVKHIEAMRSQGRVLKELKAPAVGTFVLPRVLAIDGIADLQEEIFGPVLHVARFDSKDLDTVIAAINSTGFGLTFGLHSRINSRVQQITSQLHVGNIYINRNQIGAIVGSQPFGGEGFSGSGPKAGGPAYVPRFHKTETCETTLIDGPTANTAKVQKALDVAARRSPARPHA